MRVFSGEPDAEFCLCGWVYVVLCGATAIGPVLQTLTLEARVSQGVELPF